MDELGSMVQTLRALMPILPGAAAIRARQAVEIVRRVRLLPVPFCAESALLSCSS
jgi:hypothetical protein